MGCAKLSSKFILIIITLLFWGAAAGLGYAGVYVFMTHNRYGDLITYLHSIVPSVIIISVAFLMFVIGLIGICGLFSESRCLLGTFFTLLTVLLALEIGGVVLVAMYGQYVKSYVHGIFKNVLDTYGQKDINTLTQNFDFFQSHFKCCGENNYTDWQQTRWYANAPDRWGNVPQSCCAKYTPMTGENNFKDIVTSQGAGTISAVPHFCTATSPQPNSNDDYYVNGCYSMMKEIIYDRFVLIASFVLVLIILQLIGLISTCILMFCRNKNAKQPPYINIATNEENAHFNM